MTVMAQLVDRLRQAGAGVIAFDVLFSEPDRTSPSMLMSLLTDRGASEAEAMRQFSDPAALKRPTLAEEVAAACVFLASEASSGITGEDMNVSAGLVMY